MGPRELLLTLGAITIFGITTLSVNRLALNNSDAIVNQQIELYALNLAQRFIEEGKTRAFDEFTISNTPASLPSGFTPAPLDHGVTEAYPNFDDVDDFNGLSLVQDTPVGSMTVSVSVNYVSEANLDSIVDPTKTFYKKMSVQVQSEALSNVVQADYVFAFQKNP